MRVLWFLFALLDGFLVALFVAGFAAWYVHSPTSLWWIELVATGLGYLAIPVAGAAIILAIGRRWIWFGAHILLLLLFLIRNEPHVRFLNHSEAEDDDLTFLSYNVPRWWGHDLDTKARGMKALVDEVQPDVIGLQEALIAFYPDEPNIRTTSYVSVLIDSLGYHTLKPRAEGATYTPQPVFSKIPLLEKTQTNLDVEPDDVLSTRVTRTVLSWQGRQFALYNLHMHSFGERKPWTEDAMSALDPRFWVSFARQYRTAFRIRASEVVRIREMIDKEELPVLICGDINSTPNNWVYAHLSRGMQDAFRQSGQGWGMTYHSRLPLVRIDYLFASPEWEIVSARVLDAELSDHLPLLVTLRWKEGIEN